jgi:hypothetical protein
MSRKQPLRAGDLMPQALRLPEEEQWRLAAALAPPTADAVLASIDRLPEGERKKLYQRLHEVWIRPELDRWQARSDERLNAYQKLVDAILGSLNDAADRHQRAAELSDELMNMLREVANDACELARRLEPRRRRRRAAARHARWEEWAAQGMSHEQIARKHAEETGEPVTRDAVAKALARRRRSAPGADPPA